MLFSDTGRATVRAINLSYGDKAFTDTSKLLELAQYRELVIDTRPVFALIFQARKIFLFFQHVLNMVTTSLYHQFNTFRP